MAGARRARKSPTRLRPALGADSAFLVRPSAGDLYRSDAAAYGVRVRQEMQSLMRGALGQGGAEAAPFNPLDSTDLLRWYDAELSERTIVTGVSQWNDLKGSANITQATEAAQPAYNDTGLSGLPALVFDGIDDHLFNATPLMSAAAGGYTLVVIASLATTTSNKTLVSEGISSGSINIFKPLASNSAGNGNRLTNVFRNDANVSYLAAHVGLVAYDGTAKFIAVTDDRNGNLVNRVGDTLGTARTYTGSPHTHTSNRFTIGCLLRNTAAEFSAVSIAACLVYAGVQTSQYLDGLRAYYVARGYTV